MKVMLWLYRSKQNSKGQTPIWIRLTLNNEREQFSTGILISPDRWHSQKQRMTGRDDQAKSVNNLLTGLENKLNTAYFDLVLTSESFSLREVRDKALERDEQRMLLDVYGYHNEQMQTLVGNIYTASTLEKFEIAYKHLEKFLWKQYKRRDIPLKNVNIGLAEEFANYLRIEKNHQEFTVYKQIQHLKKVLNIAVKHDWLVKNPLQGFSIRVKKKEPVFLSTQELRTIELKHFDIPRLKFIRDMFVFQCYCGLAFHELSSLKPSNIQTGVDGELWIIGTRKKTGNPFRVPILPKALDIIKAYHMEGNEYVFPVPSNQKYNSYLREIADLCGIKKELTSHTGRKTFASTVTLNNGVPIETVSALLGHQSIQLTQSTYSRVVEERIGRDMKLLRDKLGDS